MQDIKIKSQKTGQIYKFKTERDISDPAVLEEVLGNARALAGQLDEAFIARTSSSTPSGPKPTQPFEPQQPAPEYEDASSTSGSEYGDITSTPEQKQSMLASAIDAIKSAPSNAMRQFNSISTSYSDTASDKKADGVLDAVGSSLADTLRIQQGMVRGDVNSLLREENAIGSRRDEMSEAIENAGLKLAGGETIPEWMKYAILGGTTLGSVAVGSIPTMFEGGTMALGGAGARLGLMKAMKKGGKGAAFLKKNLPHDYNVLNEIAKRDALRAEYPMKIGDDILESARKKPAPTAPDGSGTTQSPSFPENAGVPVKQSVGAEPSAGPSRMELLEAAKKRFDDAAAAKVALPKDASMIEKTKVENDLVDAGNEYYSLKKKVENEIGGEKVEPVVSPENGAQPVVEGQPPVSPPPASAPEVPVDPARHRSRFLDSRLRDAGLTREMFNKLSSSEQAYYIERARNDAVIAEARGKIGEGELGLSEVEKIAQSRDIDSDKDVLYSSALYDHYRALSKTAADEEAIARKAGNIALADAKKILVDTYENKAVTVVNNLYEKALEAGRTVQAFHAWNRMGVRGVDYAMNKRLNEYAETQADPKAYLEAMQPLRQQILKHAEEAQKMPDGLARDMEFFKINQQVHSLTPDRIPEVIVSMWKSWILTAVKTHLSNVYSNAILGPNEMLSEAHGAIIDAAVGFFTNKRALTMPQVGKFVEGIGIGAKRALDTLRTGRDMRLNAGAHADTGMFRNRGINLGPGKYRKLIGDIMSMPYRFLSAEDQVHYWAKYNESLANIMKAEALTEATKRKLTGKARAIFVKKYIKENTASPEAIDQATLEAEQATVQNKTMLSSLVLKGKKGLRDSGRKSGELAYRKGGIKATKRAIDTGGDLAVMVSDFVMPFVTTPSAMLSQAYNYSPLGAPTCTFKQILFKILKKQPIDQRELSMAWGRSIVGTEQQFLIGYAQGYMHNTLHYDKSERTKAYAEATGRGYNSWKIGGNMTMQSLAFGSTGMVAEIGAYIAEKQVKENMTFGEALLAMPLDAPAAMMQVMSQQSMVTGITKAIEASGSFDKRAAPYFGNFVATAIPSFVGALALFGDPYKRNVTSSSNPNLKTVLYDAPKKALTARTPILRNTLPPVRSSYGWEVQNKPVFPLMPQKFKKEHPMMADVINKAYGLVDPLNTQELQHTKDPVMIEQQKLYDQGINAMPVKLENSYVLNGKKINLSAEEHEELVQGIGRSVYATHRELIQSSLWERLTPYEKKDFLDKAYENVAQIYKYQFAARKGEVAGGHEYEKMLQIAKIAERSKVASGKLKELALFSSLNGKKNYAAVAGKSIADIQGLADYLSSTKRLIKDELNRLYPKGLNGKFDPNGAPVHDLPEQRMAPAFQKYYNTVGKHLDISKLFNQRD